MTEGARRPPPPLVPGGQRLRPVSGRTGAPGQACRASAWLGRGRKGRAERGKDNGWQRTRGVRPPAWWLWTQAPLLQPPLGQKGASRRASAARPQGGQGPGLIAAPWLDPAPAQRQSASPPPTIHREDTKGGVGGERERWQINPRGRESEAGLCL